MDPFRALTQSKNNITRFLPRSSVELLFMLSSILNVWVGENTNIQKCDWRGWQYLFSDLTFFYFTCLFSFFHRSLIEMSNKDNEQEFGAIVKMETWMLYLLRFPDFFFPINTNPNISFFWYFISPKLIFFFILLLGNCVACNWPSNSLVLTSQNVRY